MNKDDPVKRITITRYYPVLLSSLTALTAKRMMNFADSLAVNGAKKKIQAPSHPLQISFQIISVLHVLNLKFEMVYCAIYIFQPYKIKALPIAPPCSQCLGPPQSQPAQVLEGHGLAVFMDLFKSSSA